MDNQNINLQPLISFLETECHSTNLSKLLDGLLYDYVSLVLEYRLSGNDLHKNTLSFIYYLKMLRDLTPKGEIN
ncbi:MAG: hypothetical protein LUG18_09635 [Candidatus Azobacteroides sp.]|nr:hypothetical protein [Candidatus Azobacteroides sp.]